VAEIGIEMMLTALGKPHIKAVKQQIKRKLLTAVQMRLEVELHAQLQPYLHQPLVVML